MVAYAAVQFANATCDTVADPGCDIVGGFSGFADAGIGPFQGAGELPGLPLEYILEEVLELRRGEVEVIQPVWNGLQFVENEPGTATPIDADAIVVGGDGLASSVAVNDDVQLIPFGIDGLPEDAVVVSAGEDGILDSAADATTSSTSRRCSPAAAATFGTRRFTPRPRRSSSRAPRLENLSRRCSFPHARVPTAACSSKRG